MAAWIPMKHSETCVSKKSYHSQKDIQMIRYVKPEVHVWWQIQSVKPQVFLFETTTLLAWSAPSPAMNVTFEWWTHPSLCEKVKSHIDHGNWLHTVWLMWRWRQTLQILSPKYIYKIYQNIAKYTAKYAKERTSHGPRGLQVVVPFESAPSSTQNVSTRYVDVSSCDVGGLLAWLSKANKWWKQKDKSCSPFGQL